MSILSITSHVALARVGHAAQAPVFQALRISHWAVPTVVLAGHGGETHVGGGSIPTDMLDDLIRAATLNERFAECQAVMSGYLGHVSAVDAVLKALDAAKGLPSQVPYYCDPVLGDSGAPGRQGLYVPQDLAEAIRDRLVPRADCIFPNCFEAAWLTDASIDTIEDAITAGKTLRERGANACVVTGIPSENGNIANLYVGADGIFVTEGPRVEARAKGAGDLFTALFVGHTLCGEQPARALEFAATGAGRAMAFAADDDLLDIPIIENIEANVDVEGPVSLLFDHQA